MTLVRAALRLSIVVILGGACTAGASVAPSAPAGPTFAPTSVPSTAVTPAPTPAPTPALPTAFVSPLYGYGITIPAGWQVVPATVAWDGTSAPGHEEPVNDRFEPSGSASFWAYGGPWSGSLAAFVQNRIAANARDHGDTCPAKPEVQESITVAGEPAVFIAWNCGILINTVVLVHGGVALNFAARDPGVHAATDPADRAVLDQLLATLTLPD